MAAKRKNHRRSRRPSLTGTASASRDFVLRLDHLRTSAREVVKAYLANLEHDIVEVREAVGGVKGEGRGTKPKKGVIDQMNDLIEDVAIKPHRGRRSDLKKVEKVVRGLRRLVAKHTIQEPRPRR